MMTVNDVRLKDRANELRASTLFLTRLPFTRGVAVDGATLAPAAWAFPIVGVVIGFIGALVYAIVHRLGLPAWPAAALSVAATMVLTGCLHEDGLADTMDGFGGGETREQKLAIMRDSRIGTYGVCALALSILLRVSVIASLGGSGLVLAALVAAHGASRAVLPVFMYFVPPARGDGLSFTAGRPPRESVAVAAGLGILIILLCFAVGLSFWLALVALLLLLIVVALIGWLALAQIDGQTGDVLGAVEQASEIVILLAAVL